MDIDVYCKNEVITIDKDATPLETARLMRRCHVGDVVVVEHQLGEKIPLGIVTDRDITLGIVAAGVDPTTVTVQDIVRRPLITVNKNDDIAECIVCMKQNGVRRAPVVDDKGMLVGIVTLDDIVEILANQLNDVVSLVDYQLRNEQKIFS